MNVLCTFSLVHVPTIVEDLFRMETFAKKLHHICFRSSTSELFLGKSVLLCNFIEIAFRHGCSPVNLLHIFKKPFPKNTSEGLLLMLDRVLNNPVTVTTTRVALLIEKRLVKDLLVHYVTSFAFLFLKDCFLIK